MSNEQREIERLKRLRDQQISARDPREKDRRRTQITSQRPRTTLTLKQLIAGLGASFTWMLWGAGIGLLWGLLVGVVIDLTLKTQLLLWVTVAAIGLSGGLGFYFGYLRDSGDKGWK